MPIPRSPRREYARISSLADYSDACSGMLECRLTAIRPSGGTVSNVWNRPDSRHCGCHATAPGLGAGGRRSAEAPRCPGVRARRWAPLSPAFSPRTGAARRISVDRLGKARSAMLSHRASALTRPVVRDPPPLRVAPGGAGAASKALRVAQATLGGLLLAARRPPDAMTRLSLVRNPG